METDPTRMCLLLVGLPDVRMRGVRLSDGRLEVHIETVRDFTGCWRCGKRAKGKGRRRVRLVDLPTFDRPVVLVWHKRRWVCVDEHCEIGSWTETDIRIAPPHARMTTRAGRWATQRVGRAGRAVSEVASELGCDWHTVMDAVSAYGRILIDDPQRIGAVTALGLDETLFARSGPFRTQGWSTSIVALDRPAQLLDVVPGRSAKGASEWIDARPQAWRDAIIWGVLDLSGPYRKTFTDSLPHVIQIADPFHVIKIANQRLDEARRRTQNETLGHRGRKDDPLFRSRRLLTKGAERLDERGETKLLGLLEAGDPRGEVRMTWLAKEVLRGYYAHPDPDTAGELLDEIIDEFLSEEHPVEVQALGRTLGRWRSQIAAWHHARHSNGPTEAINNLIKRIKRVGFGFKNFNHYRTRVLLYAGAPNWDLLETITPP